jgi:hypothetical protein
MANEVFLIYQPCDIRLRQENIGANREKAHEETYYSCIDTLLFLSLSSPLFSHHSYLFSAVCF